MPQRIALGLLALSTIACAATAMDQPDSAPAIDSGRDAATADATTVCHADADCDDGAFCNGTEHCSPTTAGADARGCAPGTHPCTGTCDETANACTGCTTDADGDGSIALACGGNDCDDADPDRFPGNPEVCDTHAHDEDCDPTTYGTRDGDGDGYTDANCCNLDGTMRICGPDCNDADASSHPTEAESCDGLDNDCDGAIDEGSLLTFYRDIDGDGYGVTSMTHAGCSAPLGYVLAAGDCNDAAMQIHPGATELCDSIDNDCDGITDPGCACTMGGMQTCGTSDGGGGFLMVGACHPGIQDCITGMWGTCTGNVSPNPESCNGADDDCDGTTDEGSLQTYFRDVDGDGYGDTSMTMDACAAPAGYSPLPGDCDDTIAYVHPTQAEMCNMRDDNCDGTIDEGVLVTYWIDADADGYGSTAMTMLGCTPPAGYVATTPVADCDDSNPAIHPGAPDPCNGIDDNCDGTVDSGCACIPPASQMCGTGDGMGGFLTRGICHPGTQSCTSSGTWAACMGNVDPMTEVCNGLDDDCNGLVDDGTGAPQAWYRDCDHDLYGASLSTPTYNCGTPPTPPTGCSGTGFWAQNHGDCNDANDAIHPGVTEACNGIDDDCDGVVDDNPTVVTRTYYADHDADGYGAGVGVSFMQLQCAGAPAGYSGANYDCFDWSSSVRPGEYNLFSTPYTRCDAASQQPCRDSGGILRCPTSGTTCPTSAPAAWTSFDYDCNGREDPDVSWVGNSTLCAGSSCGGNCGPTYPGSVCYTGSPACGDPVPLCVCTMPSGCCLTYPTTGTMTALGCL